MSKLQGNFMPIVEVKIWKGVSEDAVNQIISGMTKVLVDLGIPEQAVDVIIQEVPKAHWGIEGKPATKARPDAKPP